MKTHAFLAVAVALLLNACGVATKHPPAKRLSENGYSEIGNWLDRDVPKRMSRHGIAGMGIAVIDGNRVVVQKGYGVADQETERPVNTNTLFRAGSVTKSFTAMAVLQLVEQGLLDLDAPLSVAIPDFRIQAHEGSDEGVTLRRILSHHSALPSDLVAGMWSDRPAPASSVVKLLHDQHLTSTPGSAFAYSNIGYSLAGHAIARVSGQSYSRYMREHILSPLGMSESSFELDMSNPSMARGYSDGDLVRELDIRDKAAGALVTTTGDLAKFVMAVMANGAIDPIGSGERLLQASTVAEMLTPQKIESPYSVDNRAALGWFRLNGLLPMGHDVVMHDGQTMAHSALVQISPQSNLAVVILSNSPASGAMHGIAEELFQLAYTVKHGVGAAAKNQAPEPPVMTLPGRPVSGVGRYVSEFGLINVLGKVGRLDAEFGGQKWSLRGNDVNGHRIKLKLFGWLPIANADLRPLRVHFREVDGETLAYVEQDGFVQLIASGLEPQEPSAAWTARVGNFDLASPHESDGPESAFRNLRLTENDGVYTLQLSRGGSTIEYALDIVSDREAVVQGYGRNLGSTVSVTDDGGVNWTGLQFRPASDAE